MRRAKSHKISIYNKLHQFNPDPPADEGVADGRAPHPAQRLGSRHARRLVGFGQSRQDGRSVLVAPGALHRGQDGALLGGGLGGLEELLPGAPRAATIRMRSKTSPSARPTSAASAAFVPAEPIAPTIAEVARGPIDPARRNSRA